MKLPENMIRDEIVEHEILMEKMKARDTEQIRVEMQQHIQKVHEELQRQQPST